MAQAITYIPKGSKQISVPHAQPHVKAIYVERALELLEGEMDDNE